MVPGVPYAIAAKFAYSNRVVIAMVGDGAMQMNGINELLTAAKYWREWKDPRLVILVLHNNDLNQVTWEMRAMSGDPKFKASQDVPDFPYARYAELLGLRGIRVGQPDQVGGGWDDELGHVFWKLLPIPLCRRCRRILLLRRRENSLRHYIKAIPTSAALSANLCGNS